MNSLFNFTFIKRLLAILAIGSFIGHAQADNADVVAVKASGTAGAYTFQVTIKSPDIGCQQYADWWEVINEQGELLYRRILWHSHVSEQPFQRSGGPVAINPDQTVWIRAHMSNSGYGGDQFAGSVNDGFSQSRYKEFPESIETAKPQPDQCGF